MQAERCPICKSEKIDYIPEEDSFGDGWFWKTWLCRCENNHEFYLTENYKLTRWASGIKSRFEEDEVEHFEEE